MNEFDQKRLYFFENNLIKTKNCENFDFLYNKYINNELDEEFFKTLKKSVSLYEKLVKDTYIFCINILGMSEKDSLITIGRLAYKSRISTIKEMRYHLIHDLILKEIYEKKYGKKDFTEFYIKYIKDEIKKEGSCRQMDETSRRVWRRFIEFWHHLGAQNVRRGP